jgi:hypothetical protein
MTIKGFSNIVYYITILEAPGGHSAYILPPLECTCQYPYLYYLVAITCYLTSESSEIGCQL